MTYENHEELQGFKLNICDGLKARQMEINYLENFSHGFRVFLQVMPT